jgi:hypothetical protein
MLSNIVKQSGTWAVGYSKLVGTWEFGTMESSDLPKTWMWDPVAQTDYFFAE